jgi:DNA-nicking Smr family endonuclease
LPLRRAGRLAYAVEENGESWSARADGVDRRVWGKLRTGRVPREAQLDLHGLNRARALQALNRFMESARTAGERRLLVVHGRGLHSGPEGPALREIVRESLTSGLQAGFVLACCTAPPELGGAGATLVLLRR